LQKYLLIAVGGAPGSILGLIRYPFATSQTSI